MVQRQPVKEPLQTGVKAIDAMTAIGRGQRQLIIGDRQTGKTAVAIDAIINQRENWATGDPKKQVKCIYVAIGQKGIDDRARCAARSRRPARWSTRPSSRAPASDPAGFKYLAPYTGSAIGQHWMYKGQHVLIIFDDLSKQAEAYRAVSLLLRRPPGREAYPGDVFYLHSRLLERCAKLSDELGGGSMTGLPIIETKGNDVSAYIPTNVISITDGQIFLETDLFNSGVRPAINVGISVSRVGGAAQIKAMRRSPAGCDWTSRSSASSRRSPRSAPTSTRRPKRQLERGARLVELLKQPQYSPFPVERQVVSIWAGTTGHLDDVPVEDVHRFEAEFLDYLGTSTSRDLRRASCESGKLGDDTVDALQKAIDEFKKAFDTSEDQQAGQRGGGRGGTARKTSRASRSRCASPSPRRLTRVRRHDERGGGSGWVPSCGSTDGGSARSSRRRRSRRRWS